MESVPQSKRRRVADRIVTILPSVMIAALIAVHRLVPNLPGYANNPAVFPISDYYTILASVFGLGLLISLVRSFISPEARARLRNKAPFYCLLIFLLICYDIATLKTGALKMPYFPWVDRILIAIVTDRNMLLDCMRNSLTLLACGYVIGSVAGLITGVSAGWSARVRYWVAPLLRVLGPIPAVTWISIILIAAPSMFSGSVFMIALGVWYPVAMASLNGVMSVPKSSFEAAMTFGLRGASLMLKVAVPSAMPSIFTGLTQGMSVACAALMVAEMLGVDSGLGWYINWQRGWADFARMYAAVILICLTFMAVTSLLTLVRKRVLRWKEGET